MIQVIHTTINGEDFTHTYSDSGRFIVRDGVSYYDALDPARLGRTYVEGDYIPDEDREDTPEEILSIILGEENNDNQTESETTP